MNADPELKRCDHCTIVWEHGEITELKGKNCLTIARSWLYRDPECLLVHTDGWIYLKDLEKRVTYGD